MKLTKREKILIFLLIFVGGGYLYFRFVFTPEMKNINRLNVEWDQKVEVLNRTADKEKRISDLEKQLDEINKKKKALGKGALEPLRLPEILSEFEQACIKSGVSIGNLSFSGPSSAVKGEASKKQSAQLPGSLNSITPKEIQSTGNTTQNSDKDNPTMTITINFTFNTSYENLLKLIDYYESNPQLYILQDLNIKGDSTGKCIGSMSIEAYSVVADKDDFLYNAGKEPQRTNPF